MRGNSYQYALISLGAISSIFLGIFFYREIFPEYKIYQNDYIAIEGFRSSYTHEPPPLFKTGVKQILLERTDKGNPVIDRCISCHVALEYPHFSPTKVAYDEQRTIRLDSNGMPMLIPNPDFVWAKIDAKISDLENPKVNEQLLETESNLPLIERNVAEANRLKALKVAHVGEHTYDVTKVLAMHPLIGKETRPFEFHPLGEYGCTSCHSGNGRGLTTLSAHGPVFDGEYEKEFTGKTPQFTEIDPDNDPRFSKIFNGKPGHSILYQTTPIYIGALIQAKCMQCHQSSAQKLEGLSDVLKKMDSSFQSPAATQKVLSALTSNVDLLTRNYQRGEQLFINQACYACHRIAGFTRGGIGPELTQAGNGYPWFLKESLIWPQADVHASTMPNLILDHEELEDLMTYLLGQTGNSNATSQTAQKANYQEWEAGRKQAFEKPITPIQMNDLRYAMTTFATEGCASCHRLKGYDSNVGFRIENESSAPSFEDMQKERDWFKSMIPEEIAGTVLVKTIENNAKEIDQHVIDGVRSSGLLEEIDKSNPQLIATFYTPFKFAKRAKNAHYKKLEKAETDPVKKEELAAELKAWQQRVDRLMFLFAQEYGLGQLIGPRPNWSGIFRSDEWLMEHFKNPSIHVPRSIMPAFPFDETKFYALTKMLDRLAISNRDADRALWEHQGFNPATAYDIYCAQCHGDFLQGNGPVAPWIYPIPKNLRNGEFLRNLTRERVADSIIHGIKGSPMPPWGEVATDKSIAVGTPVLTETEVHKMVDWLFSALPGENVIRDKQDVPKWNYSIQHVLDELQSAPDSSKLFDEQPNPSSEINPQSYFIKKKYYTVENLAHGQAFFDLNCAVCHGKEADGSGMRAGTMAEAKPRMLTNLNWIKTRDDLHLLRSIKYGVPGTSMTPWGDLTSPTQRMQLVMYIRTFSKEKSLRESLTESIYKTFDRTDILFEEARGKNYTALLESQTAYEKIKQQREELYEDDKAAEKDFDHLVTLHKKELDLLKTLKNAKEHDKSLLNLKRLVKREKELYQSRGYELIQNNQEEALAGFVKLIDLLADRFQYNASKLTYSFSDSKAKEMSAEENSMVHDLEEQIKILDQQKMILEGKLSSGEKRTELAELRARLTALTRLKDNLLKTFSEGTQIRLEEIDLLKP
ncbi:MAG: c-type cytochrome [Parachlamydiaceae bacterium]|nr:c-type cytochrome [Parachlamydiaceae bacterium]